MLARVADGPVQKHALVTGGAGFIGSHLVDRLLAEGWRVTVADNFDPSYHPSVKWENIATHMQHPAYTLAPVDLRDEAGLERQLDDHYDVIVHLAAKVGVRPSIADPLAYQDVNVRGTQNMLELCRRRGIRHFVFASSSSVYGVNPNVPWSEEDRGLMPVSPYACSKVSGELLGHVYSRLFGIRFTALRFFAAYGPRQRPDLAIHKFARLMMARRPITVFGDGTMRRDYTYVGDVVTGVRAAMDYTASQYEIFNLGNSTTVSVRELIASLEDVLGVAAMVEEQPEQPGDLPQTWADCDKAMRLLGFRPNTPLREGLTQFAIWASETWFGEGINAPRTAAPVFEYRAARSAGLASLSA